MSSRNVDFLADLALAAEGLSPEQVTAYWEGATEALRKIADPGDILECVEVFASAAPSCSFCKEPVGTASFRLTCREHCGQATACTRCIYYLPEAAHRMDGTIVVVYLAPGAAAMVRERYPLDGPEELPKKISDAFNEPGPYEALYEDADSSCYSPAVSIDDLSCEGLGADEIDWDAHDYEWEPPF